MRACLTRSSCEDVREKKHRMQKNEALHSVIWSLSQKDKNVSLFAVETAVADASLYAFPSGKQGV